MSGNGARRRKSSPALGVTSARDLPSWCRPRRREPIVVFFRESRDVVIEFAFDADVSAQVAFMGCALHTPAGVHEPDEPLYYVPAAVLIAAGTAVLWRHRQVTTPSPEVRP